MPLRFLIVDDSNAHQKLMANLVSFLGGAMRYAANGREALQLAQSEEFDIILMDLQMPTLDGISAADRLLHGWTQHPHRPRIVAVTADKSPGRRELCRAVGMDGFVSKPYDPAILKRALQQVIVFGHCWGEGESERELDMKRFLKTAANTNFDAWAVAAPDSLREMSSNPAELAEFREEARSLGFLALLRALEKLPASESGASMEETIAILKKSITAGEEALCLTRDEALAAA